MVCFEKKKYFEKDAPYLLDPPSVIIIHFLLWKIRLNYKSCTQIRRQQHHSRILISLPRDFFKLPLSLTSNNYFLGELTVFKPMLLRCILVFRSKRSSVAESRAHTNLSGDFLTCMTSFYEHTHSASYRPLCRAQHRSSSRFFSHCPPHFTRLVSGFFLQQRTVLQCRQ